MFAKFSITFLLGVVTSVASPTPLPRAGTTALSPLEISSYKPYTLFSKAAYCPLGNIQAWSCGATCNGLAGFIPYASGGGLTVPHWYVGYYPALNSVIVGNQGTNVANILELSNDINIDMDPLDATLFPGVPSDVQAHSGFQEAQRRSATAKLAAVKKVIKERNPLSVTLTGHGSGGAISLLDALYLSINLPPLAKLKVVTYGMPRVGNPAFANMIDTTISDLSRINNEKDVVPILPGRFVGFTHPSGEKHIVSLGNWVACAGQENPDVSCTDGTVPNIFVGNANDNLGPYDGVTMGSCP